MSQENIETEQEEVSEAGLVDNNTKSPIHCLTIIGQIEGHQEAGSQMKTTKYEHVIPQLIEIEENPDIKGLLIILNTVGGDVEAGLALSELIRGMKKPTASLVLGGGHSIGIPLAVSTNRSFIVPTATMTVHPVRQNGTVLGVPQMMNPLQAMQDRIINFVSENSGITKTKFSKLMMKTGELVMDVGTVIDGIQAVEIGLIDEIGYLSNAFDYLHKKIQKNK